MKCTSASLGIGTVAGLALAMRNYRRWHLRWGATESEALGRYEGDDIIECSLFSPTRAITINASTEDVWPWIMQMGVRRAGFYSYDLLDNLGHRSAETILPEWQNLQVGDIAAPMSPFEKAPTEATAFRIARLLPNRCLLWQQRLSTWVWVLEPLGDHQTRLITRIRARYDWSDPFAVIWVLLMELGDFPMMRKQLIGIKRRAESHQPDLVRQ